MLKKKPIILLSLALGLGFTTYMVYMFWSLLFRETYIFTIHTNLYNEFWFEFIFFNICFVIIFIALILGVREIARR